MKKLLILIFVGATSHLSIAQADAAVGLTNPDTTISKKLDSFEQRLKQQEDEIIALKKEKVALKNQVNKIKPTDPARPVNRKVTISRRGSKQGTFE